MYKNKLCSLFPELLGLTEKLVKNTDTSQPPPTPAIPTIVVDEFSESCNEGHHSRSSTDDSEQTPLIKVEKQRPGGRRSKSPSTGSLFDLKNYFNSTSPERDHPGDLLQAGDIDLENGNSAQTLCGSCISSFSSMPTKNKTMSQPSVLFHVEDEMPDLNANKYPDRRSSVQFSVPTAHVGADHVDSRRLVDSCKRNSMCSSIPELHSEKSDRSEGSNQLQDCRIHCNPRRARTRSTSTTTSVSGLEMNPSVTLLQNRRTSRTFTVINYGNNNPNSNSESQNNSVRRPSVLSGNTLMVNGDCRRFSETYVGGVRTSIDETGKEALEDEDNGSECGSVISSASRLQQYLALKAFRENYDTVRRSSSNVTSDHDTLTVDLEDIEQRLNYRRKSVRTCTKRSIPEVAKRGALYAHRKKTRLVNKEGDFNIHFRNISNRHKRYLADVFTTLLDMQWRYNLLLFIIAFVVSWLCFALVWWLLAYLHGDTQDKSANNMLNGTIPCVVGVIDFTSALLFSIETQHTIGYGVRAVTTNCPEAVTLLMTQSIFGVVIQCVMAGVVLAKLARPKRRGETIMFSRHAVICQEDGQYCLIFRVGDMRRSQLVGAMLHAMFVKKRTTKEGDEIPFYQCHLEVTAESEDYDQFIFLSWPIRIVHKINSNSPLWHMNAESLLTEDFEIIVVLEGVVEATGMCMQVRTSYLPSEVAWSHRLSPLVTRCNSTDGKYEIDYAQFHGTIEVEMPDCSASELHGQKPILEEDEPRSYTQAIPSRRRLISRTESFGGSHFGIP